MKHTKPIVLSTVMAAAVALACGGGARHEANAEPARESGPSDAAKAGNAVGEKILATFDAYVAASAEVMDGNPDWSEVAPKLAALRDEYEGKMSELNGEFVALKGEDVESFGAAVSYVQEHRGKRVADVYTTLQPAVAHYRLEEGVDEFEHYLDSLDSLINIAVALP